MLLVLCKSRAPAQFRARVRNAPCAEALSSIVTVSP
jgi:hypothetical protein